MPPGPLAALAALLPMVPAEPDPMLPVLVEPPPAVPEPPLVPDPMLPPLVEPVPVDPVPMLPDPVVPVPVVPVPLVPVPLLPVPVVPVPVVPVPGAGVTAVPPVAVSEVRLHPVSASRPAAVSDSNKAFEGNFMIAPGFLDMAVSARCVPAAPRARDRTAGRAAGGQAGEEHAEAREERERRALTARVRDRRVGSRRQARASSLPSLDQEPLASSVSTSPAANMNHLLTELKRIDDRRPSLPGEHWLTLVAGIWLLTRGGRSALARLASVAAGAALLYRAASGRDGLISALRTDDLTRRLPAPTRS